MVGYLKLFIVAHVPIACLDVSIFGKDGFTIGFNLDARSQTRAVESASRLSVTPTRRIRSVAGRGFFHYP